MKHVVAALIGSTLASLLFFVIVVTIQTVRNVEPPLVFENGRATAYRHGDETLVVYSRDVTAFLDVSYTLDRAIECDMPGNYKFAYDAPPMMRTMRGGDEREIRRVLVIPIELAVGTHCKMKTLLKWTPLFSMRERTVDLGDMHFFTEPAR